MIVQDADLEYDPEEDNLLLRPVLKGFANVLVGLRLIGNKPYRILFLWHSTGNGFLTFLSNLMSALNLTDIETCHKLLRRDIIQSLQPEERRFGFEPEATAKVSRVPNLKLYEVGSSYYGRTYAEGKKTSWRDGYRAIYRLIKYSPLRA